MRKQTKYPNIWDLVFDDFRVFIRARNKHHARIKEAVETDIVNHDNIYREHCDKAMKPHNGEDSLKCAYRDLLDGVAYLRKFLEEHKKTSQQYMGIEALYHSLLWGITVIKGYIERQEYEH
jgi:hypothetical protein